MFNKAKRVLPKTNTEELADILKVNKPRHAKIFTRLTITKRKTSSISKAINDALDDSKKILQKNKIPKIQRDDRW